MRNNKLKPLVIGDITIKHPLALAPMAGVTDLPYRLLCKEQGAGMMCTDMVSAKGLYYGNRKSEPLMATDPKEMPVAIQIFGSDPEIMGQMAAKVNDGRFQMIDINILGVFDISETLMHDLVKYIIYKGKNFTAASEIVAQFDQLIFFSLLLVSVIFFKK